MVLDRAKLEDNGTRTHSHNLIERRDQQTRIFPAPVVTLIRSKFLFFWTRPNISRPPISDSNRGTFQGKRGPLCMKFARLLYVFKENLLVSKKVRQLRWSELIASGFVAHDSFCHLSMNIQRLHEYFPSMLLITTAKSYRGKHMACQWRFTRGFVIGTSYLCSHLEMLIGATSTHQLPSNRSAISQWS